MRVRKPLGEYVNGRFYYGIKTGFNEAFVIDEATRKKLISEDRRARNSSSLGFGGATFASGGLNGQACM